MHRQTACRALLTQPAATHPARTRLPSSTVTVVGTRQSSFLGTKLSVCTAVCGSRRKIGCLDQPPTAVLGCLSAHPTHGPLWVVQRKGTPSSLTEGTILSPCQMCMPHVCCGNCRHKQKMPLHLIDLYNFKPPADLIVNREESQAIRINAAKTSLVRICATACIRRSAQQPASTSSCQPTMSEPLALLGARVVDILGLHCSGQTGRQMAVPGSRAELLQLLSPANNWRGAQLFACLCPAVSSWLLFLQHAGGGTHHRGAWGHMSQLTTRLLLLFYPGFTGVQAQCLQH
jgi:hypothetical protein